MRIALAVVGLDGVEPSTSRLSGVRSNRTELQAHRISEIRIRTSEDYRFALSVLRSNFRIQSGLLSIYYCQRTALDLSKLNSGRMNRFIFFPEK